MDHSNFKALVVRGNRLAFSIKNINDNFDRFKDDPAALCDALDWLAARNVIRGRLETQVRGRGRKPSPTYEVNPALLEHRAVLRFLQIPRNSEPAQDSAVFEGSGGPGEDGV